MDVGTIFYNPMRILIGSIAMVEDGEEPGITSPDYVVFRARPGVIHPLWFYHWLRSGAGERFIKTLARGAVRERMLFRRLAAAELDVPPLSEQQACADRLRGVVRLRQALQREAEWLGGLPPALLSQAFGGVV